ncbi:MAG: CPBP family intramembrane metalloprotease [bacterium]|nr:CPBP family intramembrane metalloprotease [bacterium]
MSQGTSPFATLYRYELRMLLRDRRTIIVSVVLPILVMPLILFASQITEGWRQKRIEAATYSYAVTGTEAALARELIAEWQGAPPGDEDRLLRIEEADSSDPATDLDNKEIDFYIEALSAAEAAEEAEKEAAEEEPAEREPPSEPATADPEVPVLRLVFRANSDASRTAFEEMRTRLESVQGARRRAILDQRGFPVAPEQVAALEEHDVATASQVSGATLGRFATLFVLLFMLTGGSVVAADAIAGEKERGTLETMLTTAVSRTEIVAAKQLLIVTVGVFITVVQLANLMIYVGLGVFTLPASFEIDLSAMTVLLLLLLFLPLAALSSSVLLLVSGVAKTYKEFQLYFFPIFMVTALPACAAMMPGLGLRSVIAVVPVANISVAVREVLVGERDWMMLAVAWMVSMATAVVALRATMRALGTERLITASEIDRSEFLGGAEIFPRRVGRWFALMWVIIFMAVANVEQLTDLRSQVLFNLIVVFLGGSLLMIRRYRLDMRQALALRAPRPLVWLAVLLGAPAALLSTMAIAKLSFALFPLPTRLLEEMTKSLVPEELPLWELLLLVAVLPGICEEIAFRGVLLHGLRRRLRPFTLCLVVGGVFALFHFTPVRILPVAYLGVMLTALTLLTGSIFPAMLWHALYNAAAILAERKGIPLAELDAWTYGVATGVLVLVFWLLWRIRTPYPDLRRGRSPAAPGG